MISGWERSPFDLRPRGLELASTVTLRAVIPPEVAATLRSLLLVDTSGERLVFRARTIKEGIVLFGNEEDLDELIGFVAAEANHDEDRRRQKRLDQAFEILNRVLNEAR